MKIRQRLLFMWIGRVVNMFDKRKTAACYSSDGGVKDGMNRTRLVAWAILLGVGSASGYSLYDGTPPKWFTCKDDSDCTTVDTGCMAKAVNKKHETEYRTWARKRETEIDCLVPDPKERKKLKPVCKLSACAEETTKNGLPPAGKECGPSPIDCASGQYCDPDTGRWRCP